MKHLIKLSLAVLAIVTAGCSQDWEEVKDVDGRFRVMMPEQVHFEEKVSKHKDSTETLQRIWDNMGRTDAYFYLSYSLGPLEQIKQEPTEAYDTFQEDMTYFGLELESARRVFAGKCEGREFVYLDSDGAVHRIRLFYADGRLYMLSVVSRSKRIAFSPDAARFFNSFRLL